MHTQTQHIKNKKGFTLLEILIVMTIVALILPTVFAIVFVIMRQQVRIYRVVETRRQGDYILNFIKDKIIRSKEIGAGVSPYTERCPVNPASPTEFQSSTGGIDITFVDQNDVRYQIYQDSATDTLYYKKITSPGFTTKLNDPAHNIAIDSFTISCYRRSAYAKPIISVAYNISYVDATPTTEEGSVDLHYQTKVRLR